MKILIISDLYYPHIGGVSEHIYYIANEFEKMGHYVRILTGKIPGGFKPDERRVIRLGMGVAIKWNKSVGRITIGHDLLKTRKIMNAFDVNHIHGGLTPTYPLLTLQMSEKTKIFTFHSTFDRSIPFKILRRPLLHFFKKIDGAIAVSETAKESFSRYFPGDYRIIPNGVDINRFTPSLQKEKDTLLFVGRLEERKGLKYLIKALKIIHERGRDLKLIVVGGGYRKYRMEIPNGIKNSIQFTGFVSPESLPEYYKRAEIFVSPATGAESFGIVLIEAMASATPVLASDIPGYRTVIKDMENGLLVPPKDPAAIAEGIIRLLNDKKMRQKIVKNGLKTARFYSWDRIAKQIIDFYYEINPSLS